MGENPGNLVYDIHHRQKRLQTVRKQLLESDISKRNKNLIQQFIKHKINVQDLSVLRQVKYYTYLRVMAEQLGKDFDKATRKDINRLMDKIYSLKVKRGKNHTERGISTATKYDYAVMLKTFYKWLKKKREPEETQDIIPPKPKNNKLHPEDILTWEDVIKLSQCAMNPRDKALVQVLWDSGARIEELLTLQLQDVEVVADGRAAILHIRKSKTEEGLRDIAIPKAGPALIELLRNHPLNEKTAHVFVKTTGEPLSYSTARKILQDLKKRSKIDKPVNPHAFRKASITYYSTILSEMEVKTRYGFEKSSRMLDIYCRLDDKRVNEKILELHGMLEKKEVKRRKEIEPIECKWCGVVNAAGDRFCSVCKRPLIDSEDNMTLNWLKNLVYEKVKEVIEQDPQLRRKIMG